MKFSEKNQLLKQAFSCTMKFWKEKIPKCQVLYWEFLVPADFIIKNFSNNHILEKKFFPESQFLISIFFENSGCDEKFTSEKKRFDSICSTENNKFFTFCAYFKRHDFEASLFMENENLKWNSLKKRIRLWSKFFLENETLNWKFSNMSAFELRIYRPGRYRKQKFSNNLFFGENLFSRNSVFELNFYWEIRFRWKIHIWKKNVLTKFTQQKTTNFSFFVPILEGMILTQSFSIKIRVSNEFFWKKESDSEANVFLHNENLKRKISKRSGFELRTFRSGRFYNNKLFPTKWDFEMTFFQSFRLWIDNFSSRQISKTKLFE